MSISTRLRGTAQLRKFGSLTDSPRIRDKAQGAGKSAFLPFHEARAVVRQAGLKSWREWVAWCAAGYRPSNVPSSPFTFYEKTGLWQGFADWLGYEGRTRTPIDMTRRKRDVTEDSKAILWPQGKKDFVAEVQQFFQCQVLPHRSNAGLLYKKPEDRGWFPVVVRSVSKLRPDSSLYFHHPKFHDGHGIFLVVTSPRRTFFFPHEFLATIREQLGGKSGCPSRVQMKDAAQYEITAPAQLLNALSAHRKACSPLSEMQVAKTLFSISNDQVCHSLAQGAVDFLRAECGIDVQRPSESPFFDMHFVAGGMGIVARCCTEDRSYMRMETGRSRRVFMTEGNRAVSPCQLLPCPDLLMVLIRSEEPDPKTGERVLVGFFLFPRNYLQAMGVLVDGSPTGGRSGFNVYPPFMETKKRNVQQRQCDQKQFYIDISCTTAATLATARMRARKIFAIMPTSSPQEEIEGAGVSVCDSA